MIPSDEQVTAALEANTAVNARGLHYFHADPGLHPATYSEITARKIVTACLVLGVPITSTLTGQAWHAMVMRLVELERRIEAMTR